jgi:eukaryotic-like serine/threonine-protein kinase
MAFNINQDAFNAFADIAASRSDQLLVFTGAGISADAGLPSWQYLRTQLIGAARRKAELLDVTGAKLTNGLCDAAEGEPNLWESFDLLRKSLGETSYIAAIRKEFELAARVSPPSTYRELWELRIAGFLTLNIDRLAIRSFSEIFSGRPVSEFTGFQLGQFATILRGGAPFVANLHGILDDPKSWVFTKSDFDALLKTPGYKEFLISCFATRTVLFVGISADDTAAGGHLERLKNAGINLGGHYWVTTRNDTNTVRWAEQTGIRTIFYNAPDGDHSELTEFFFQIRKHQLVEPDPAPLIPPASATPECVLVSPEKASHLPANEVRQILNAEALRILQSKDPDKLNNYAKFWDEYNEAIYKAWYLKLTPPQNRIFDYEIKAEIAGGAFGQVFEAVSPSGDRVALKLLHQSVKDRPLMLEGFRRGVAAMKILSERNVEGMVPYLQAWEIPACTVMEMVDGPNLEQALDAGYIDTWQLRLRIAHDLVKIIRTAHHLPERILHRDIRPANIMLKGFETMPDSWEVVVLDFDLSWHRDALGNSVSPGAGAYGYLAPEQVTDSGKSLTRNALVDSFGVGMTIYFLISGEHPLFAQHRHGDWAHLLRSKIASKTCGPWKSLPRRVARLIEWATKDTQDIRWDMTRIEGELDRLSQALCRPGDVNSAELIAEEIASRCDYITSHYQWNIDRFIAEAEIRPGFSVKLIGREVDKEVGLELNWSNAGESNFEGVRRFLPTATDKAMAELRAGQWSAVHRDMGIAGVRLSAKLKIDALHPNTGIDEAGGSLSAAIGKMRLS